jgi:hypothetical protein
VNCEQLGSLQTDRDFCLDDNRRLVTFRDLLAQPLNDGLKYQGLNFHASILPRSLARKQNASAAGFVTEVIHSLPFSSKQFGILSILILYILYIE